MTGLLLVDKPSGCTSHDVVGRVRYLFGQRRVGHAGTLDPMATGLLVLAVGRATRLLGHLALTDKTYLATIRLGRTTTTDDAEGDTVADADPAAVTEAAVTAGLGALTGALRQVPSAVSAVKVDGRRAYDLVRAGEQVELRPRPVTVTRFALTAPLRRGPGWLDLDVVVDCSTGTYVRALARDLGTALGVGGHLTRLRRTRVGGFDVAAAVDVYAGQGPRRRTPGERPARVDPPADLVDRVGRALRPVDTVVRGLFPVREVGADAAADLRHGRALPASGQDGVVAVFAGPAFLGLISDRGEVARPVLVWSPA